MLFHSGPVGSVPYCAVCSLDNEASERYVAPCGHGFCSKCWQSLPGAMGTNFSCPADVHRGVCGCQIEAGRVVMMRRRKVTGTVENAKTVEGGEKHVMTTPLPLKPHKHGSPGDNMELFSLEMLAAPGKLAPQRRTRAELEKRLGRAEQETAGMSVRLEAAAEAP